jgi:RNA polymerase sigma-70 factor, ECF subfamily
MINSHKDIGQPRRSANPLACLSEAPLVERAVGGDVAAFEELVRRTEDRLYRLAMRYVHDQGDTQEILQNAYLAAWRNLPSFERRAQFGSWMHRITVNAALMCLRARSRQREIALADVEGGELDAALGEASHRSTLRADGWHRPDHAYQSAELRSRIAAAVSLLPPKLRATLVLREVHEMSMKDAAGTLGVTVAAVKTRLLRARRALRQSLVNYVAC